MSSIFRLIIGCLLGSQGALYLHEQQDFLKLLVACRRALKCLLLSFCEGKSEVCRSIPILLEVPSSVLWLLGSLKLVTTYRNALSSQHNSTHVDCMIVSLLDQTSYVFVNLCKHQCGLAIRSISSKSHHESKINESNKSDCSQELSYDVEACRRATMIIDALEEEIKSFLLFPKEAFSTGDVEVGIQPVDLSKLSSVITCIQGFL